MTPVLILERRRGFRFLENLWTTLEFHLRERYGFSAVGSSVRRSYPDTVTNRTDVCM
jgi:hypothetical protein